MIDEKKLIEDIINTPSKVMNEIPYEATMFTNIQDRQNEILDIIDRQPKVGQWIPCSERLPNNDEYDWVLAQVQEDNAHLWIPKVMEYRESINDWYLEGEFGGWLKEKHGDAFKVIAWMPLPEPYKEGE